MAFNVILFCGTDAVSVHITIHVLNMNMGRDFFFHQNPFPLFSLN